MEVQVPQIVQSKKFIAAAIASGLSFFAVREGMSFEQVAMITGPLYAYIGGQSLADFGKERERVRVASPQAPIVVNTPTPKP